MMKSKSIHSSAGPDSTGANLIEKILSTDAVVILMAIVLVLVLVSLSGCAPVPALSTDAAHG